MAKDRKTFRFEVHTPDGPGGEYELSALNVPALDGYMGVLAGRAPVTAVVTAGLAKFTLVDGQEEERFVSRGFLRVSNNAASLIVEECVTPDQLDAEKAWDILQQAYALPSDNAEQVKLRDEAVDAGRLRFAIAQKARKGMMSLDGMMSRGLG